MKKIITVVAILVFVLIEIMLLGLLFAYFNGFDLPKLILLFVNCIISISVSIFNLKLYKVFANTTSYISFSWKNILPGFIIIFILLLLEIIINPNTMQKINNNSIWLNFISAIIPSILEETMFRGILLDYLNKWLNAVISIAIVSALFGILHLLNILFGQQVTILYIINAILGGVLLSIVYLEYGLIPAIMNHAIWNAILDGIESNIYSNIPLILLIIGLIIYRIKKKNLTTAST